jgi:hypothetical protein
MRCRMKVDLTREKNSDPASICCILSMYPRNPWIGRLIHNNLPKTLKRNIGLGLRVSG